MINALSLLYQVVVRKRINTHRHRMSRVQNSLNYYSQLDLLLVVLRYFIFLLKSKLDSVGISFALFSAGL